MQHGGLGVRRMGNGVCGGGGGAGAADTSCDVQSAAPSAVR